MNLVSYSPETLSLFVSMYLRTQAKVEFSKRVKAISMRMQDSFLMLNPSLHIHDLLLALEILRTQTEDLSEWSSDRVDQCGRAVRRRLSDRLGGFLGTLVGDISEQVHFSKDTMVLEPLNPADFGGSTSISMSDGKFLVAGETDVSKLTEMIESGEIPTVPFSNCLWPVATIPYRVIPSISDIHAQRFHDYRARFLTGQYRDCEINIARCWKDKAESLFQKGQQSKPPVVRGLKLDSRAMHRIGIAQATNLEAVFEDSELRSTRNFDPASHRVAIGIDLNASYPFANNPDYACVIARVFGRLGIAKFVVTGFLDRLVTLESGKRVLLHLPIEIATEQTDLESEDFWRRLYLLSERPPSNLPGIEVGYQPLHFQTAIEKPLRQFDLDDDANFFTWILLSPNEPIFFHRRLIAIDLNTRISTIMKSNSNSDWGMYFSKTSTIPDSILDVAAPGSALSLLREK